MNIIFSELFGDSGEARDKFLDCEISLIKHGYNRSIYILESENGKNYVAKKGNTSKDHGATNLNDVRVQSFLKSVDCDFVPEIVYWDAGNDIYVETCAGDSEVKFDDLDKEGIDTFAKQLVYIHSLTADRYRDFCIKNGFEVPQVILPTDSLRTFGFERFEIVKALCPDQLVISWLRESLQQNLVDVEKLEASTQHAHLKWGDIGENLRTGNSKLYFIDWEYSGLGFGNELSYVKIHSHPSPENFKYLISRYSAHSGTAEQDLLTEITQTEKINRTGDVVWAAMKWGQAKTDEDREKYKKLTYLRMQLADGLVA